MTQPPPHNPAHAPLKEGLAVFCVVFVLVLVLALLALGVGVVAANLYALVAAVFVGVPYVLMSRRGLDPQAFGLHTRDMPRQLKWGVGVTLLTLAPFAAGQYLWNTQVLDQKANFQTSNYAQWPAHLKGAPASWGKSPGVWVWTLRGDLHIGMRVEGASEHKLILTSQAPFVPLSTGGALVRPYDRTGALAPRAKGPHKKWEVVPSWHHRPVKVVVSPRGQNGETPGVTLTRVSYHDRADALPLHQGPQATPVDDAAPLSLERGYWWMLLWLLTQLFFIALPEEYFYRGYLQTRLDQGFAARADEPRWLVRLGLNRAVLLTSLLFGLGHLLIPVQGVLLIQRMSVCLPALVFGWLRLRTDSIVAATIYHAGCNLMVLFLSVHYA